MLGNEQSVGQENTGSVVQIKGNNNQVGLDAVQVTELCNHLIEQKLQPLQDKAKLAAWEMVDNMSAKIYNRLDGIEDRLFDRFSKPAMQYALRETLAGMLKAPNPTDELADDMVELLIDRLGKDDSDIECSIIDEVRSILPRLNKRTCGILAFYCFFHLTFPAMTLDEVETTLRKAIPIFDAIKDASRMEMQFLIQNRCIEVSGFIRDEDWVQKRLRMGNNLYFSNVFEKKLLEDYILSIKQETTDSSFDEALQTVVYPFLEDVDDNYYKFKAAKKGNILRIVSALSTVGINEQAIETVKKAMTFAAPCSNQEVDSKMCRIYPHWQDAIGNLKKIDNQMYALSLVGQYIGLMVISKYMDIKGKLGLEMFYPMR